MPMSRTISEILSLIWQNSKWSHDSEHISFGDNLLYMPVLTTINLYTKFEVPSFNHLKDMIKAKKVQHGSWSYPRPFWDSLSFQG